MAARRRTASFRTVSLVFWWFFFWLSCNGVVRVCSLLSHPLTQGRFFRGSNCFALPCYRCFPMYLCINSDSSECIHARFPRLEKIAVAFLCSLCTAHRLSNGARLRERHRLILLFVRLVGLGNYLSENVTLGKSASFGVLTW